MSTHYPKLTTAPPNAIVSAFDACRCHSAKCCGVQLCGAVSGAVCVAHFAQVPAYVVFNVPTVVAAAVFF